ncbi:MAG: hypothetical protein KA734_02835, partial [Fluviicola sp.]|nr:hypothetical protein [Fluviicola sp.]
MIRFIFDSKKISVMKSFFLVAFFSLLSHSNLTAQNFITVPFSNGFVGDNTANNQSTNAYFTAGTSGVGLGWTNLQFAQNSTASIFTLQGNDIVGSVLITDASGVEKTINGFIKWRAPSGQVTTMCFQPTTGTNVTLATNGTNGSSTYTITDTKYIGLTFNGQTLSISGVPGSVSGNAATSGLLDALNNYLALFPKLTIGNATVVEGTATITVPVTLSAAPTSDVKVYFSVSDSSAVITSDFLTPTIPAAGFFTFLASQPTILTKNITIPIVNDAINEPTEYFKVILSDPTNGSITDGLGIVTITDNDPVPTADAGPATGVICSSGTYTTTGTATNGTIAWTSSGTGTFANATLGATLYTPSAADISSGTVTLTMTVTGSGLTVSDNLVLTINPSPTNISASVTSQPTSSISTGTITVAAPTGANLLYSVNGSTYQSSTIFSGLTAGTYPLTVKNNTSSCVSTSVSLDVIAYVAPPSIIVAGTCDPESLYDLIVSAFHQSVAQKNDGSWSGWGQNMNSDGTTPATTPQDIIVANYPGLTGTPLIATTASNIQDEQSVLLTTTGLFAWGIEGVAVPDAITSSTSFQKLTINSKTDGLPVGVTPSDVVSLVAIHNNLILRTQAGFAYILSSNTSGATTAKLYGDGSTSINNNWHQVKIDASTPLGNIIALRGQVASDTKGAFVALTYDGSAYKAYTWGMSAYKGDNTAVAALGYATEMTLPSGITPRMIAITGGFYDAANTNTPLQRNNSYYVVATNGNVYALGANDVRQLGDLTTTERRTWVQPKINATTFLTNVKYLSAQEHDSRHPAAGVITNSGDLYLWGQNGGNMLGSSNTDASLNPFLPDGFTSGVDIAKVMEVGGHTTVYLKENSAKFCYVGHKTQGSMGDGITASSNPFTFNCDATPVMNICGSTGWDLGDAPIAYENGGGSNYAQHFYIENSTKLYLGTSAPTQNDDNPHSVIIATDNNGTNGDGAEENGVASFTAILNTASTYSFNVSLLNNTGSTANIYAWVDWNNNGKFEASEFKSTTASSSASAQTKSISYTGLSGLNDGRRYVRIRLSTYTRTDVSGTTNVDERSIGLLMDGEIEDYSLFITTSNPNPNQFPITNNVTNATVLPLNASTTDLDDASSSDADGTVVAYRIISLPTNGTLYKQIGLSLVPMSANEAIVAADFAVLKYQPTANYAGNDVFTYAAIDDDGAEDQTPANFNIVVFVASPTSDAGLATSTICANSTVTLNGTATNGTLLWSTLGTGTFSDATISNPIYTPSAADVSAGSVKLKLTVTGTSTSAVDSITVSFTPLPTVDAGNSAATVCSGNNLSLSGTAANGSAIWTTAGSGTFINASALTTTYTPSASDITNGSIKLYLTNTGSGSCSSAIVKDSIQFSINPTPSTPLGSVTVQPTCATTTGTIVFTTQSGVEYSINGSTYQSSATFNGVAAGTYTLKVRSTTDNTCTATGATVTVNAVPSAPSTPVGSVTAQPTCGTTTGTIVFTTQSGVEYSINGSTYQSGATFNGVAAGSYTLKVRSTTDNTCTATGATVTVNAVSSAPSTPVGSVTVQPTCATTTGTIVFTTQSGVEYSINGTTYQSSANFNGVAAGTYTLKVRSTTDNTCSTTGSTVTVNALPSVPSTPVGSVTAQPTCGTTTGTIVFTTQSGVEYSIDGTTYQAGASFTGVAAGTYTLKVRSTTDNTCTATGATVTVNALSSAPSTPVGSVTAQPTCGTTTGTIVFTTQSGVEYSIDGTTYQAGATFTGVAAGTYTLKVRSTTDNTCSTTGSTVTVNAAPSAPSTPVGSVTVQPTCATTTGTIVFTTQSGVEYSIDGTTYQAGASFTGVAAGTYTLKVRSTTDNTCSTTGSTVTVNALPSVPSTPVGSVTAQPTCGTTTGTIVFTTQSGVEYSINGSTYQSGATFNGVAAGTYTLKVRSTTDNTCTATGATVTVNAAPSAPSTPLGSVTVQPTCATTTGTIVFTTQSGVEYSINGSTYQTSATFTGVAAGTYTLKVRSTTDNTCTTTGSTVTVNAVPSAPSTPAGSVTVQPTCATTTGTIVFTTQSGVEYSIDGTTYQAGATITGVAAGTYTLKVRSTT